MTISWKFLVLILAVILIAFLALRLTRTVQPYTPPSDRDTTNGGTIDADVAQELQAVLDEEVNLLKVPGLQAFVRTADGRTWSGVSGTVDLKRKVPMRRDHVLRVGSVTKTFTAVVILKLVEEGKLALDDPLAAWFPDYPNAEGITVRQMLEHTSGLPDILETSVLMQSIPPWKNWQPQETVEIASRTPVHFAPGGGWWYSNTNYILLGMIAERVSGETMTALLHEMILEPLALGHTYFVPYEEPPSTLVPGWDRDLSHFPGMLDVGPRNLSWPTAAYTSGALASNAEDLAAFFQGLFAGELLTEESMSQMTTFVEAINPGFEAQDGYGLGLMRLHVDGIELIGHVGEFMASTSIAMVAPRDGHLVVVNCNLSYPDLVQVLARLQDTIRK